MTAVADPAAWTVVYSPHWAGTGPRPSWAQIISRAFASAAMMRSSLRDYGVPADRWQGTYSGEYRRDGSAWTWGPTAAVCVCGVLSRDLRCLVHPAMPCGTPSRDACGRLYAEVSAAAASPRPGGYAATSRGESAGGREARAARRRVLLADRKHPWPAELASARSLVWAARPEVPGARPCLDVLADDGRRVFVRLGRDGTRRTDAEVMRDLAATLTAEADRLDAAERSAAATAGADWPGPDRTPPPGWAGRDYTAGGAR